jgi:uncharacterized phage protein (TIGR02218 family)
MRSLPQALIDRIESGSATLCHVWLLTRTDGVKFGFTDHDRDLVVEGVTCQAATGWTAGAAETALGFSPGSLSASGVLDSDAIGETDIQLGQLDHAAIELRRVDWSLPDLSVQLWQGHLSKLTREGERFTAEIEGPLGALDRMVGRTYGRLCDADLGDHRCGVAVSDPAYSGQGQIVSAQGRMLTLSGLDRFEAGWLSGGMITPLGGPAVTIAAHSVRDDGKAVLILQSVPSSALREVLAVGTACTVRAGCDKAYATCRGKFANHLNFQGFPHIPGDDFLSLYPVEGEANTGGSRRA